MMSVATGVSEFLQTTLLYGNTHVLKASFPSHFHVLYRGTVAAHTCARLAAVLQGVSYSAAYYGCKYFVRFLHEILKKWYSVVLFPPNRQKYSWRLPGSAVNISRRSRTSCSTLDMSSKQTGAICAWEDDRMKFFALGGKTLTFKKPRLVFRSPLVLSILPPLIS